MSEMQVYVVCKHSLKNGAKDVDICCVSLSRENAIEKAKILADQNYEEVLKEIEKDELNIRTDRYSDPGPYYFRYTGQKPVFETLGGCNNSFAVMRVPFIA